MTLGVPPRWDDVDADWMTAALEGAFPGARVDGVELLLRDDGTNRRARYALTYAEGSGPATVFVKAESDVPGRREIHFRNGNLFNEPRLFASGVELPLEHARAYCAVVDEAGLDYVIVFEDLDARGATPRHSLTPFTVDEAARGLRELARLHSRYWDRVDAEPALAWVQPYEPTEGVLKPMRRAISAGVSRISDQLPDAVRLMASGLLVEPLWATYLRSLATGPQTLLHGDPHIGNTYTLPDGAVGFLDWQVVRRGHWSHDVGYFLQGALTIADRRAHERALLGTYLDALDVAASERLDLDDAWVRYCTTPVHGLVMWLVTLLSDVHVYERSVALATRYAAAFTDLETVRAISHT